MPLTAIGRLPAGLLDLILPPRCLACAAPVDRQGGLCGRCWSGLSFITRPCCARCGLPFAHDLGRDAVCAACAGTEPAFARARAALVYDDASRPLILAFKHADRTRGAGPFGGWMARAGAELLADAELIVPVPLHRRRLAHRLYNQSALLAQATARASGVAWDPLVLARRRATPSQAGLGRLGRARNVAHAFAIRPGRQDRVAGRRLVLIDDVLTTGATVEACARVLLRAGASRVDVLTLARVVPDG